ncbi:LysR family transcriptional regulator [Streptomyces werraensis]|uniref:LysR family transcriptional regulator n=1 Tax=Streptomyces werraensis TaxID=68284 RepID=A0ABV3JMT7_9ACTN
MPVTRIERLDLNLLPPLAVLLEEKHVSRAAERAHLSQPAMSRTLQRLRDAFGDELLVRGPSGYQLTPVAERLQDQLRVLLPGIAGLLDRETFSPRAASEEFCLTGTDYAASTVGEHLFRVVLHKSPNSRVRYRPWHEGAFEELERGTVHLAFFGCDPAPPFHTERLFEEKFVCVVDRKHPLADAPVLDLDDYLRAVHVVVDISRGRQGIVDANLRRAGVQRTVGLTVPYHQAAMQSVAGTKLVATLPQRLLGRETATNKALRVLDAPEVIKSMTYLMVWHPRLNDDPAQRWLRERTRAVAESLHSRPTRSLEAEDDAWLTEPAPQGASMRHDRARFPHHPHGLDVDRTRGR